MSEIGALRVRVLPDFAGFRGAAAAEGHAAGNAMGAGLAGAVREHWKGLVGGLAVAELGKQVVDFAKESVDAFKTSASGATVLQRTIGGTVEDTSRLRFALHEMGVGGDQANILIGRLSKTLVVQSETSKGLAGLTDKLGFSVRDATGHLRPMAEILPKLADRFKELPSGAEKTALAIQLFGRSGQSILRFLNQGSEGIAELEKESDKFGNTISTKGVASLKEYGKAQRDLNAASEGLRIKVGQDLIPVLAQFETWLAAKGIPALEKFGNWIHDNIIPIVKDFAKIIQNDVIPPLKTMFEFFQKHPAVLHAVETAAKTMIAVWAAWKIAGLVTKLWEMAAAIGAVGTASATAAAEGTAGVAAGAEGAAAGGAARLGLLRLVVPVAITYAATSATGLNKELSDIIHGQFTKAAQDAPKWVKETTSAIDKALGAIGIDTPHAKATQVDKILGNPTDSHAIQSVSTLYGQDAAKSFSDALVSEKGNVSKAWQDVYASIGGIPDFFTKQGTVDGQAYGKSVKQTLRDEFPNDAAWGIIDKFQAALKNSRQLLDSNTNSLEGNTAGAISNRKGITLLVTEAEAAAHAYAKSTGKTSDYSAALRLAIPQIEDAAAATGLNRGEVDKLVTAILGVPLQTENSIKVNGYLEALNNVNTFLASLAQIPSVVRVPIETFIASPTPANQLAGSAFGVDTVGHHAAGGVARGWSLVGERGPELIHVGSPSAVIPHGKTMAALGSGPLLNIENWHGDQTDAAGLASMLNAQQRAYAASKGI